MEDQYSLVKLKVISFILLLVFAGCTQRNSISDNSLFLNIYGDCEYHISVKLNNDVVYSQKLDTKHQLLEVRRGPYYFAADTVKIYFSIDSKDTTFNYPLMKSNYWSIGFSDIQNEFQFMVSDSTSFFNSRID